VSTVGGAVENASKANEGVDPDESVFARRHGLIKVLAILAIVIGLFLIMRTLPVADALGRIESWIESLGAWGPIAFGVLYVVAAVAFVPGSALTLASGALFGVGVGFVIVSIASTTGAALAFLIARHLARNSVQQLAKGSPKFNAADRAIGEGGWRIVAMLRLVPMFPFSVGNYLLGLTPVGFLPYVLASWIGMMPGTLLYVYFGHIGRASVEAAAGAGGRTPMEWVLIVVGLLAALAVTVYLTRLTRRKLAEQTDLTSDDGDPGSDSGAGRSTPPTVAKGRSIALLSIATIVLVAGACATLRPNWSSGLFGPPRVVLAEAYADRTDGATFDHSAFDALLKRHVNDDDGGGWVDYAGLAADGREALRGYLEALAKADLDALSRDELLALLINAYNAATLELILEYGGVQASNGGDDDGERAEVGGLKSIRDIPSGQRWTHERWNIGGNVWSLDQIEHQEIRPKFKEPRIHWVVVCAAIGCPPLRSEAYTGAKLEAQLADQARIVHTHPRWFRLDREAGVVHLTRLYDWYGDDFVQVDGGVLDHAAKYNAELRAMLDAGSRPQIRWLDYDWDLNTRTTQP